MTLFKDCKLEDCLKDSVMESWMNELIDDVSYGLCFEIHRSCKKGYFLMDETDLESHKQFQIVNKKGLDVFGQVANHKKQTECLCPTCQRCMVASRFAPHLEKCMGMGRISSRIASRRIASGTQNQRKESEGESSVSDNNDESYHRSDKKAKRIRKDKSSSRRKKKMKMEQSPLKDPSEV